MKAKSLAFLISFILPGSAYAAQCNQEAWTQAKLRCANLSDPQQCYANTYMAIAGYEGFYECRVGEMNKFADFVGGGGLDSAIKDAQEVPGTEWGTSSNSTKSSPPANNSSPNQFNGVAPFSSNSPNAQNRMPARSMQNGMLPPSVMQMMQQFQTLGQPYSQPQAANCQGVTTSTITGFDQNGAEAAASKMKSHEILQLVRSQQNNGKKYYLASNGFWYDAGYIKRGSNCSL